MKDKKEDKKKKTRKQSYLFHCWENPNKITLIRFKAKDLNKACDKAAKLISKLGFEEDILRWEVCPLVGTAIVDYTDKLGENSSSMRLT